MHSVRAQSLGGHHYFLKQRAAQVCECAQTEWAQPPRRQGGGHISLFFTMLCKASQREAGEWVAVPLKSLALFKREKMPAFLPHKHTLSDCTALCIPPYSFSTLCLLAEDSFKNSPRTILAAGKQHMESGMVLTQPGRSMETIFGSHYHLWLINRLTFLLKSYLKYWKTCLCISFDKSAALA